MGNHSTHVWIRVNGRPSFPDHHLPQGLVADGWNLVVEGVDLETEHAGQGVAYEDGVEDSERRSVSVLLLIRPSLSGRRFSLAVGYVFEAFKDSAYSSCANSF